MRVSRLVLFLPLALASMAIAHAAPAAGPSNAQMEAIVKGMTGEEVVEALGEPAQRAVEKGKWVWVYHPYLPENLTLRFGKKGKVEKVWRPNEARGSEGQGPGRLERFLGAALTVTEAAWLVSVCPQLRRTPVVWWTGGDYQTWQACLESGGWVGPVYVYTGRQP